jgi:hypothetical protein
VVGNGLTLAEKCPSDDKALLFINTIINKLFRFWCGPRGWYKQEKSKRTEQQYRNQDRHTDPLNYRGNHRPGSGSGFGKRCRMPVRERSLVENSS